MNPYFSVNNLETSYGNFKLGPVSLELDYGEYLVILGPTGCGKTSLLRNIAGISRSDKGYISINGDMISSLPPDKRNIGYVTQTGGLFPHLTVRQNVGFGLKYRRLSYAEQRAKTDRFMQLFELSPLANQSAATLSGGETKRVAMARSLVTEPKLILLDEPLGMLDHNGRKKTAKILKMIHEELKTTVIHVTHDRHETWDIALKCAVMNNGMILQTGTAQDLFRKPETRFTAEFLGGTNIFDAVFEKNTVRLPWIELKLPGQSLTGKGWVLIRPEKINIVSSNYTHKFSGKITAMRDSGEFIEIQAESEKYACIAVHASIENTRALKTGDAIYLDWNEDSVHPILKE